MGRDPSPVLDRYPPKAPASVPAPAVVPRIPTSPAAKPPAAAPGVPTPPPPLLSLERPFDIDEFSQLLGETAIRVTVPRESLAEVLRRISEFMGFGIYVYSVTVRPADSDLLKGFVVELQRVDFSREQGRWVPFVEQGASDNPFGPGASR